jgi:hypothetical protein
MKTNITLNLDAGLVRDLKALAAESGTSISALLTSRLEQIVRERRAFNRARMRASRRLRKGMNLHWSPARSRDDLHKR